MKTPDLTPRPPSSQRIGSIRSLLCSLRVLGVRHISASALDVGCRLFDVSSRRSIAKADGCLPPSQLLPGQQVPAYSSRCGGITTRTFDVQRSAFNVRCSPFRVPSSALRIPRRALSCRIVPDRAEFMPTTLPNHMKPPLDGTGLINLISPARWTAETIARPNIFSDLMRLMERFVL